MSNVKSQNLNLRLSSKTNHSIGGSITSKPTIPSIKKQILLPSAKKQSTTPPSSIIQFSKLPSDCVLYILDFCGTVIINSKLCIEEFTDESFISWRSFLKDWFGRFKSDGRIKFLFNFGQINECKKNANLARVQWLLWKMISLTSSNSIISYWETQLVAQITKISEKKMTFQKRMDICSEENDNTKFTKERKIEETYLDSFCKKLENLGAKSKKNQELFNSTKFVNFEDVPRNLELLKPIISSMENIIQLASSKTLKSVKLHTLLFEDSYQLIIGFPELKSLTISDCIPLIHISKIEKLEYFEFTVPSYPGLSRICYRFANLGLLSCLTSLKINQIEWNLIFGNEFRDEIVKLEKLTCLNLELYGNYESDNPQFKQFFDWLSINVKSFKYLNICKYDKVLKRNILIKYQKS